MWTNALNLSRRCCFRREQQKSTKGRKGGQIVKKGHQWSWLSRVLLILILVTLFAKCLVRLWSDNLHKIVFLKLNASIRCHAWRHLAWSSIQSSNCAANTQEPNLGQTNPIQRNCYWHLRPHTKVHTTGWIANCIYVVVRTALRKLWRHGSLRAIESHWTTQVF